MISLTNRIAVLLAALLFAAAPASACFPLGAYYKECMKAKRDLEALQRKLKIQTSSPPGSVQGGPVRKKQRSSPTKLPRSQGYCFIAGTMVLTPQGYRPIETLVDGMQVLALDMNTGKIRTQKIYGFKAVPDKVYGTLHVNGRLRIGVTPKHRFYVADRQQWVEAESLGPRETLLFAEDAADVKAREVELAYEAGVGEATVYKFEVEADHNYFVEGVLVHNFKFL